jgi:probable phosphoglycerate mutase/uncharacterized phosphatase
MKKITVRLENAILGGEDMATNIYFVRHGETEWNKTRRIQGHYDVALNETGILQAKKLSFRFKDIPIHGIYSSDLARAKQTAQEVANVKNLPVITFSDLRERCYGLWEGKTYQEIISRYPQFQSGADFGGLYGIETFESMQQRSKNRLLNIAMKHVGENVIIVSHGGLINCFLHLISQGQIGTGKTKLENTSVSHIVYDNGEWDIRFVNDTTHFKFEL